MRRLTLVRDVAKAIAVCACLFANSAVLHSAVYTPATDGTVALVTVTAGLEVLDISVSGISTGDVDGLGTITLAGLNDPPNSTLLAILGSEVTVLVFDTDFSAVDFGPIDNETLTMRGTGSAASAGAETVPALSALFGTVTANFFHTDEFIPGDDGGGILIYRLTSLESGEARLATPEPATISLFALALGVGAWRRARKAA
jgi:hypothetical protein